MLLRRVWLFFLLFPIGHLDVGTITPEPSLLQARQSQFCQLLHVCRTLQSPNHLCGPLLDSLLYAHVCIELGSPKLDPALELCLTKAEQRGRSASLNSLAMLFLMQTRRLLGCFAARVHGGSRSARYRSLQGCFAVGQPPACTGAWGYSAPGVGLCTFLC